MACSASLDVCYHFELYILKMHNKRYTKRKIKYIVILYEKKNSSCHKPLALQKKIDRDFK
jgi:hypothetical protein